MNIQLTFGFSGMFWRKGKEKGRGWYGVLLGKRLFFFGLLPAGFPLLFIYGRFRFIAEWSRVLYH